MGLLPTDLQDPYPDTVEYFTSIEEKMREYNILPLFVDGQINFQKPSVVPRSPSGVSSLPRTKPSKS